MADSESDLPERTSNHRFASGLRCPHCGRPLQIVLRESELCNKPIFRSPDAPDEDYPLKISP